MRHDLASTWPPEVRRYLDRRKADLIAHRGFDRKEHEAYFEGNRTGKRYQRRPNPYTETRRETEAEVERLLQTEVLRGWHCTRLTDPEIDHVVSHGMGLPGPEMLGDRIWALVKSKVIDRKTADKLIAENEAEDEHRQGMIWFCFFPPAAAGQHGIERFFRCWGGEALYNSHEVDPVMAPILGCIGQACVIEADVPVHSLAPYGSLGKHTVDTYLAWFGVDPGDDPKHEAAAIQPIPAKNIVCVIRFGDNDFESLTDCSSWDPPIG
jgi:hypothetical protein